MRSTDSFFKESVNFLFVTGLYLYLFIPVFWSLISPDRTGIRAPVETSFSVSFRQVHVNDIIYVMELRIFYSFYDYIYLF